MKCLSNAPNGDLRVNGRVGVSAQGERRNRNLSQELSGAGIGQLLRLASGVFKAGPSFLTRILAFMIILAGLGAAAPAGAVPVPSGLVAWWPGDGTALEVSVNANHGAPTNGATFAPGQVGDSFGFDGVNDFISVPDQPIWAFGQNDFTIQLWASFAASDGRRTFIASDSGTGTRDKWIFWLDKGKIIFHINGSPGSVNIGSVPFSAQAGEWYHLAVTRQGSDYAFYVNGVLVGTATDARAVPDATAPLTIGSAEGANFFKGQIDEPAIFNRALTTDEIASLHAAGSLGMEYREDPAPIILRQPVSESHYPGESTNFWVAAMGSPRPTYQWLFEGTPLDGQTGNRLQLTNLTPVQAGSYSVQITNSAGETMSDEVSLTIQPILFPEVPEGFESGTDGWYADGEIWQIGIPTSGPPPNPIGNRAHEGNNVAATVLNGNYYEPNGNTGLQTNSRLISPTFVVPAADQLPRLRFWHWHNFNVGPDYGEVQIKVEGGSWQAVSRQYMGYSNGWTRPQIDLTPLAGQTVQLGFFFHAQDNSSETPETAPGWYIDEVQIITGPLPNSFADLAEDFEDALSVDSWIADNGVWEIGQPTSGPGAAHEGVNVAATVLNGNYYEPNGRTGLQTNSRLISPTFVVPAADQLPRLRFWHWHNFNVGPDYGEVQIKVEGGSWQAVSRQYMGYSNGWTRPQIDLTPFAGQTVQLGFFFHAQDNSSETPETAPGWYIDEVQIITGPLPNSFADLADDFEEASSVDSWIADNGVWEIGQPTSGPGAAHGGVNVAATVLNGNYYEPNGRTGLQTNSRLISPTFVVAAADQLPRLRFWHWHHFNVGPDYGEVQIKVEGGEWKPISLQYMGYSNGWTRPQIDLTPLAGQTVQLGFFFHAQDNSSETPETAPGWYIDEVQIVSGPYRFNDPESFETSWGDWDTDNPRVWQIGVPTSGPPEANGSRAHSGTSVAATLLGGNYAANSTGRLITPRFTVPSVSGDSRVIFRFWHWYQYGTGDTGSVQVKGAYDTDWVTLLAAAPSGTSTGWQLATFDLTAYQGQEVRVGFLHTANSDKAVGSGWYIDDISLSRATPSRITLDGQSVPNQFGANLQNHYYVVKVPSGGHLRIVLDDLDNLGINEVYVRRGLLPTAGSYDYKFKITGADQSIFVPDAGAGDWFILVYNDSGPIPADYTLEAEISYGIGLESVEPNRITNSAAGTVSISGAGFTPGTTVSLLSRGSTYSATDAAVVSSSRIIAEFDFTSVPVGNHTLRVANGPNAAELPFTVFAGGQPNLTTKIIVPRTVGYHTIATIWVEYANTGDAAMPAPVLEVSGRQNNRRAAILTLDGSRLVQGFWTSAMPVGFANSVQFLAHGKSPGLLQPGESGRVPVYYAGWQKEWDFTYPPIHFDLSVLSADNTNLIDWESLKDYMRPSSISAEAWEPVFANLIVQTGATWGDYVRMLNHNARYLAKLGQTVTDIRDLLAFEVMQARGLSLSSALSSAVDAQVQAPGLPLFFSRSFGTDIPSRFKLGRLGRGWSDNWDRSLNEAADGTVTILGPNGSRRIFQPDSRSTSAFFSETGDTGTLKRLGGDALSLTEGDGTLYAFRTDGKLDYLQDTHDNRITCAWSGDQLTRLSHSAGPFLNLTYAGARLASITDSLGRETTFTYDAAAEHLQSATTYRGETTVYGYSADNDAAEAHALKSVHHPDGTESTYTYDARGHLHGKAGCCGSAEATTYTCDAAGKITITDALGHASQFYLDHRGRVARTVNPLGNVTSRTYDSLGRLVQATDPAGRFKTYAYDERGNLTSETDTLGYTTRYTYTALNRLASLIDAKGNVTRYEHEADGDLAAITYADGSRETWTYDEEGNRLTWTNRRGQTIQYTNDTVGRVIAKHYPDGTEHTFTYDAQGNLASYTDPLGTTTQEFDTDGRLKKITYPGNRWLSYTYGAGGRRESMTDQLGHRTDYHYDARGRLERLTDETGTEVVRYEYDAAGRMERKTLGNGVYATYDYDNAGQVLELSNLKPDGSILSRFSYSYDSRGRRDTMTTTYGAGDPRTVLAGLWSYDYDDTGQLVGWTAPDGRRVDYTYDALGNRLNVRDKGVDTVYTVNNLNQYNKVGSTTYQYDADGNLANKVAPDGTTTYEWSFENKLARVTGPAGVWERFYDAKGNRARVRDNGTVKHNIVDSSGLGNLVGEYVQGASTPLAIFRHGFGLVSSQDTVGATAFYAFDAIGNTGELIPMGGTILNGYVYSPFGELLFSLQTVGNPFQYVGEFGVMADNDGHIFMRNRSYASYLGAFISPDPIGIRGGDINFRRYVANNPIGQIDPTGLDCSGPSSCRPGEVLRCQYVERRDTGEIRHCICRCEGGGGGGDWPGGACETDPDSAACRCLINPNDPRCKGGGGGNDGGSPGCEQQSGAGGSRKVAGILSAGSDECGGGGGGDSGSSGSSDPNELLGPSGYGLQNLVDTSKLLAYRINFENDKTATAPAHEVVISNPLSANLDWSTFELSEIAFGNHFIAVPSGSQHFTTVEKMTFNGVSFEVHIEAGIHLATGEVYARFQSLNPLTGLPPAVDIGFLPPEDQTGRGQGHVSYVIKLKPGLANLAEIRNIASIVFDGQPPITTNQKDPHDPSQGTDPAKEALITIWTGPLPIVLTEGASGVTASSATLNGAVSPNGYETTVHFEYGLTPAYGSTLVATLPTVTGSGTQNVSAAIGGLQPGTPYHYRLVAVNSLGTWLGEDATFTTAVPRPTITSLSPTSGPAGTVVTITGANFGTTQGTSAVKFKGVKAAQYLAWSDTEIRCKVPAKAATGQVKVTRAGRTSNGVTFTVIPAPTITSISPVSGSKGTAVIIKGTNFGATRGASVVKFKGVAAAKVLSWSETQIKCRVPAKAATGKVKVTTAGGTSNGVTFTVTATFLVSAGPDQKAAGGDRIILSGANSVQVAKGNLISAQWRQMDGPSVTLADPRAVETWFPAPQVGPEGASLAFELTITTTDGSELKGACIVNITEVNSPPVARAGADQKAVPSEMVTLNGFASEDPEDGPLNYAWEQIQGPSVILSDPTAAHPVFAAPEVEQSGETLVFELTVTDADGLRARDRCVVNVVSESDPPQAMAGLKQHVKAGSRVTLDGSPSVGKGGAIVSYQWRQTAGKPVKLSDPTAIRPTFSMPQTAQAGEMLVFELTVTDAVGLQQKDKVAITVESSP